MGKGPPLGFDSERDIKRLAGTVYGFERLVRQRVLPSRKKRQPSLPAVLFRATEDIAREDAGECNRADIDPEDYSLTEDEERTDDVVNLFLPKIWADCYLLAEKVQSVWVATIAYSATIVLGELTADCTGSAFSIENVAGLDGEYPAGGTISDIANPFSMEGDEGGYAIAAWQEDQTTPYWIGIQMECPA